MKNKRLILIGIISLVLMLSVLVVFSISYANSLSLKLPIRVESGVLNLEKSHSMTREEVQGVLRIYNLKLKDCSLWENC